MRPLGFRRQGRGTLAGLFVGVLAIMAACSAILPGAEDAGAAGPDSITAVALPAGETFTGRVTRVIDGDTFWISSADVRIRVWGLDAPESGRPGGSQATATLSNLISGQTLTCRQRDTDRYGRIVGQCFLPDGRDITAAMIASGTAREFCRYSGNLYRTC
jgi:endonuclease YncB( thermonuclease family)